MGSSSVDNTELIFILEKVKSGDVQSYTHVIRLFQKQIFLYCYYLLKNREEAEDATQEIFIKGLENINRFSYNASFSAWLYKIAHNHCTDLIKIRSKHNNVIKQYQRQEPNQTDYTDIIHDLLENLTLEERQILLLRSLEEYSYSEISLIMDLKPTTVRKKYERIRKKLMQQKELEGAKLYEQSFGR
ncbi:RNA polymerase sigma-70 factor (ECF subfamily) [Paenibacillus rhizosphaerae]|uniref:RNA polymerase sigma-70 factor (ECF subfamily) n=1 Tax=Paenibacillus rhizosphaerae TaxID=297318 RepID=A0A839U3J6_9BACL|nr:RNA polymerase sigma factor [Paenibacillus rhizosphaerae]MBB3132228.1 RNA polymerase sigma-70 factor (ECF subfamily) [Paenibacillus rhizosphaerae]